MTYAYHFPPPPYRRNRRFRPLRWLLGLLALGLVLVLGGFAVLVWAWSSAAVDTVGAVAFEQRLRIPPLAGFRSDAQRGRVFDLTAQEGTTELLPGTRSDTWGFNGSYLGPTLRAERGERVAVRVTNELGEPTSVHWHGMHLPGRMDGGPHQQIAPGGTWTPHWRVTQPASTLWYHPHPHGDTEQHVYRGLAGMFILDDPDSRVADRLPHRYGVDDIPVMVQDVDLDDDGELSEGGISLGGTGLLGDTLLVNGTYGPYADVSTTRVRLRLVNASTARVYDFGFADDRAFAVIGSDGGLLPAPVRQNRVTLSPGERAEVVVTVRPGERVALRSYPPDVGAGLLGRFAGGSDSFDVLQLRAADRLAASPALPTTLAPAPGLGAGKDGLQEVDRRFELTGRSINGAQMDMARIDHTVELGDTEVWEVRNRDEMHHNFHVHGVRFAVLSVDGGKPPPDHGGWKDTIYLRPGATMRIAMRFGAEAGVHAPYMFHCHLLMHEDDGMMGQLAVVRPGEEVAGTVGHEH